MRGGREGEEGERERRERGRNGDRYMESYCQIPTKPFYLGKAKGLSFSSKVFNM